MAEKDYGNTGANMHEASSMNVTEHARPSSAPPLTAGQEIWQEGSPAPWMPTPPGMPSADLGKDPKVQAAVNISDAMLLITNKYACFAFSHAHAPNVLRPVLVLIVQARADNPGRRNP